MLDRENSKLNQRIVSFKTVYIFLKFTKSMLVRIYVVKVKMKNSGSSLFRVGNL
jgi:hypothetical protein